MARELKQDPTEAALSAVEQALNAGLRTPDTALAGEQALVTHEVGDAIARAVESGNLSVNSNSSVRVQTPFGGFKQSGVGRELGPHALEHYTEVKTVFVSTEG